MTRYSDSSIDHDAIGTGLGACDMDNENMIYTEYSNMILLDNIMNNIIMNNN